MGFHAEIPPSPRIYTNGHSSDDDGPYKILYHQRSRKNSHNYSLERGYASEDYVEGLFQQTDNEGNLYFPWIGIEKIPHGSELDRQGADFVFHLTQSDNIDYAALTGISTVRVDVKSSETGVRTHMEKGMKIGNEWWKYCMVVLDAGWPDQMIYADFVAQLTNLVGILDNQEELEDFLLYLHPTVSASFQEAMAADYMGRRKELLDWVKSGLRGSM